MIEVVLLSAADPESEKLYADFLRNYPEDNLLFYYTLAFRDLLAAILKDPPLYLLAHENGEPLGILPGFLRTSGQRSIYNSLPFFGPNAGILCEPSRHDLRGAIFENLFAALTRELGNRDCTAATIYEPLWSRDGELYEKYFKPDYTVVRSTLLTALTPEQDWDKSIRWDISKAAAAGIKTACSASSEQLLEFYEIYAEGCSAKGIPVKPREFFETTVQSGLLNRGEAYVRYAFGEGGTELAGGIFLFCGPKTVSYYVPAVKQKFLSLQVSSLLVSDSMADLTKRGLRWWNWEGSPANDDGVYRFKQKWNSVPAEYRVHTKLIAGPAAARELLSPEERKRFQYYFAAPRQFFEP